jgi:hypothetical protein
LSKIRHDVLFTFLRKGDIFAKIVNRDICSDLNLPFPSIITRFIVTIKKSATVGVFIYGIIFEGGGKGSGAFKERAKGLCVVSEERRKVAKYAENMDFLSSSLRTWKRRRMMEEAKDVHADVF